MEKQDELRRLGWALKDEGEWFVHDIYFIGSSPFHKWLFG
jgi:hypothetical protein